MASESVQKGSLGDYFEHLMFLNGPSQNQRLKLLCSDAIPDKVLRLFLLCFGNGMK